MRQFYIKATIGALCLAPFIFSSIVLYCCLRLGAEKEAESLRFHALTNLSNRGIIDPEVNDDELNRKERHKQNQ